MVDQEVVEIMADATDRVKASLSTPNNTNFQKFWLHLAKISTNYSRLLLLTRYSSMHKVIQDSDLRSRMLDSAVPILQAYIDIATDWDSSKYAPGSFFVYGVLAGGVVSKLSNSDDSTRVSSLLDQFFKVLQQSPAVARDGNTQGLLVRLAARFRAGGMSEAGPASSFVSARPLPLYRRQAAIADFGSCNATPDIIFALGLDGRKDPAFQAKNNNVYNHGSALGIGVITSFICQQLNDKCKASTATLDACAAGQAAAAKETGGAAADAFNAAFGIETKFASSGPNGEAGATTTVVAATTTATETATDAPPAATDTATETAPAVTDTATETAPAATETATTSQAAITGLTGQAVVDAFNAAVTKGAA
ncbi:hypothetical protein FRC07_007708 [Ceratobasidium sp. 392]|nr:hypothetical protein FRC07_007708 [Ceratobasidium sp. 392]